MLHVAKFWNLPSKPAATRADSAVFTWYAQSLEYQHLKIIIAGGSFQHLSILNLQYLWTSSLNEHESESFDHSTDLNIIFDRSPRQLWRSTFKFQMPPLDL